MDQKTTDKVITKLSDLPDSSVYILTNNKGEDENE